MKTILILQLLLAALFAHSSGEEHIHFFHSLHVGHLALLLVAFTGMYLFYKAMKAKN